MKLKKKIALFIGFILAMLVFGIIFLGTKFLYNTESKETEKEKMELSFESRVEKLKDFETDYYKIGWLQVQGTNIDLPILDFSSANNNIDYSYGWRSATYNTGENREVLLGHNILNVSSTPSLSLDGLRDFESLMSFSYASFAKDNLYIQYTKDGIDELYAIYAVGFYNYYYDDAESMSDLNQIKNYIKDTRKNSVYDYDIEVDENDQLLTIKTCTRYFGLYEKQQFIIDARKVREDEEIVKYNVQTNELFDELLLVEDTE